MDDSYFVQRDWHNFTIWFEGDGLEDGHKAHRAGADKYWERSIYHSLLDRRRSQELKQLRVVYMFLERLHLPRAQPAPMGTLQQRDAPVFFSPAACIESITRTSSFTPLTHRCQHPIISFAPSVPQPRCHKQSTQFYTTLVPPETAMF